MKKNIIMLLFFSCSPLLVSAQSKPEKSYVSKAIYFAKYSPLKGKWEQYKTVTNGELYKFAIYKNFIVVTASKTIKLKILSITPYENELSYGLEDDQHLNFVLTEYADAEDKRKKIAQLNLRDFAKDNTPLTSRRITCKRL